MSNETKLKHYKICPDCSYFCNLNEQDEFCSLCGAKLIDTCQACGKEIENPYARYCKSCGSQYPGSARKKEDGINF